MVVELAEDELNNFGKVWVSVFLSISYCYAIGKLTSKGVIRLIAISPVIALFFTLPLKLTSLHFCGFTSFFISWLANFKLILFAFGKPPLCFESDHPITFFRFLALSCLPIKIHNSSNDHYNKLENESHSSSKTSRKKKTSNYPNHKTSNKIDSLSRKFPWRFLIKGAIFPLFLAIYQHSDQIPQKILWLIYSLHIYLTLEIILALLANSVEYFLGEELEPQFNEPISSSTLQDFWGKRWNLMVSNILRPTIYNPTKDVLGRVLDPDLARMGAIFGTFLVSALMHELIFFYLLRVKPTFEVTWFFVIHGFCVCLEIWCKKKLVGKWRIMPPRWLKWLVTAVMVVGSAFWLFLPPLLRAGLDTKGIHEYTLIGSSVIQAATAIFRSS